jgi:cysteine desulfurase
MVEFESSAKNDMTISIPIVSPRIYLDYAAATPPSAGALRAARKAERFFANPSSIHADGVRAKAVLEAARIDVARAFRARAEEVFFTSGGTEGIVTAVTGIARAAASRMFSPVHVLALATDHAAVTQAVAQLERTTANGAPVDVEFLPVDERGFVRAEDVARAIRPTTALIIMSRVNGELGIIHPTRDVARAITEKKTEMKRTERDFPYFVVDACQSPVVDTIDRQKLGADVVIIDSMKCYGPRGVGAVMKRHYVPMEEVMVGGGQEDGMRSGTQNVPAIVGMAYAVGECEKQREREIVRLATLRDAAIEGMMLESHRQHRAITVNGFWKKGDTHKRAAHIASVCIEGASGEMLALRLDARNISCSHASACASSSDDGASTVVAAFRPECAASTLRISVGRATRPRHIRAFIRAFAKALAKW